MSSKAEKIRQFLTTNLGLDLSTIPDDGPLFTSGAIDSFALLELLSFLESEFGVKVDISELNIDSLDTISALAQLG